MPPARDQFTRKWITDNAVKVCAGYEPGVLTLRGLHYQLVSRGMTNSVQHYKRVVSAMIKARRGSVIAYGQFSDHDREAIGYTDAAPVDLDEEIAEGKQQINAWMDGYSRNRWENQPRFLEVWIEKKALQGVFGPVCTSHDVALCPCKGYPSLTFLHDASERFFEAEDRNQVPTIVYFGDRDPSGEDIPRAIRDSFTMDFGVDVDVQVIGLTEQQCLDLHLPAAPVKPGDSRSVNFTGLGQIELDAVRPEMLQEWAEHAIEDNFDELLYEDLQSKEEKERKTYRTALHEYVANLE